MVSNKFTRTVLITLLSVCVCAMAFAAPEALYKDINGNWVTFDPEANPGYDPSKPDMVIYNPDTDDPVFNVTFQDVINGNGFGFDIGGTTGANRQARVADALTYIAGVLAGENGPADIHFNVSELDGTGALASCGSYFWSSTAYQGGFVHEHITTGADPSGSVPDAQATVDFGYSWYIGTGSPGGSQTDFWSVMVHEMTHALGFTSLIEYGTGLSEISGTNPGAFSFYDYYLGNGNGTRFFTNPGNPWFSGDPVNDLRGLNNGVYFYGPAATAAYGTEPEIYAPSTWQPGSSISHWEYTVPSNAVMLPSIGTGPTNMRRTYLAFEIASLEDLQYSLGAPVPTSTPVPPTNTPVEPTNTPGVDVPASGPVGLLVLFLALTGLIGFPVFRSRK